MIFFSFEEERNYDIIVNNDNNDITQSDTLSIPEHSST